MDPERLSFRTVTDSEVGEIFQIEKDSFPVDEACSLDALSLRQQVAGNLFVCATSEDAILGFICSSRYGGDTYVEESLKDHQPNARNVCIHSICVKKEHQRKGIALALLKYYINHVKKTEEGVARIALICKSPLIPLYTRANFTLVGASKVVHGKDKWYEMEHKFT